MEVKAVESLVPVPEAQLLTYLPLGGWTVGLFINFNVPVLKQGIRRRVLALKDKSSLRPLRLCGKQIRNRSNIAIAEGGARTKCAHLGTSDLDDVSEQHDRYLAEIIADEHLC